eukprot:Rmarinus@m.11883
MAKKGETAAEQSLKDKYAKLRQKKLRTEGGVTKEKPIESKIDRAKKILEQMSKTEKKASGARTTSQLKRPTAQRRAPPKPSTPTSTAAAGSSLSTTSTETLKDPTRSIFEEDDGKERSIFISGLGQRFDTDQIQGLFERYGEVAHVRLVSNGRAAIVRFFRSNSVEAALRCDDEELRDLRLTVSIAKSKQELKQPAESNEGQDTSQNESSLPDTPVRGISRLPRRAPVPAKENPAPVVPTHTKPAVQDKAGIMNPPPPVQRATLPSPTTPTTPAALPRTHANPVTPTTPTASGTPGRGTPSSAPRRDLVCYDDL